MSQASFECLRGEGTEPRSAEEPLYDPTALSPATEARVLKKSTALALSADGKLPSLQDLLVVRAYPKPIADEVTLTLEFLAKPIEDQTFPVAETPFSDSAVLFVAGPEEASPEFAGVTVIDVTEETEQGFAPSVFVEALKLEPIELPTVAAEPDAPSTVCVRMDGMLFDLNKAFLLPGAMEGIRLLRRIYDDHPAAEVLVVGHTDTTGKTSRNLSLSLERAQAVIAYLTDDVEAWYANYSSAVDASRRWGFDEDGHMLSVLPAGGEAFHGEHQEEHTLLAAVKRFQEAKGLEVDGDPGPITRRAIITDYMALDGTTLPEGTVVKAHGCGEHFLEVETADGVEEPKNRRVEMFVCDDGIDPAPTTDTSGPGSELYPAWREATHEFRTVSPSADGVGDLLVVTDIRVADAASFDGAFELRSTDEAFEQVRRPQQDMIEDGGFVDLQFTGLPLGSYYTLTVTHPGGRVSTVFEDVPYAELSAQTDALGQTEFPPHHDDT